jgi:hypothetical protein
VGRFTSFDPILHPEYNYIKSSCSNKFTMPTFLSLLSTPMGLNPFVYVNNNALNTIDPSGYGILDISKCFYYANKWSNAAAKCENECGESIEDSIAFSDTYGGVSIYASMTTCVCSKLSIKDCAETVKACIMMGYWIPRP